MENENREDDSNFRQRFPGYAVHIFSVAAQQGHEGPEWMFRVIHEFSDPDDLDCLAANGKKSDWLSLPQEQKVSKFGMGPDFITLRAFALH